MRLRFESSTPFRLAFILAISTHVLSAQKADVYIHDMAQALLPGGTIQAPSCHQVDVHPATLLERFAAATGQDEKGEITWSIYAVNALSFSFDLSDLDEDRIRNDMVRSLASLSAHQTGTPYPAPDLPVVLIPASDSQKITVHAVDLDKLDSLPRQNNLTESEMGVSIEQRKAVLVGFRDKDHADAFVNALKKAIIACKAE